VSYNKRALSVTGNRLQLVAKSSYGTWNRQTDRRTDGRGKSVMRPAEQQNDDSLIDSQKVGLLISKVRTEQQK